MHTQHVPDRKKGLILGVAQDLITFMVNRPAEQERRIAFRYLNEVKLVLSSLKDLFVINFLL